MCVVSFLKEISPGNYFISHLTLYKYLNSSAKVRPHLELKSIFIGGWLINVDYEKC